MLARRVRPITLPHPPPVPTSSTRTVLPLLPPPRPHKNPLCPLEMIVQRRVGVHVVLQEVLPEPTLARVPDRVERDESEVAVTRLVDPVVAESSQEPAKAVCTRGREGGRV